MAEPLKTLFFTPDFYADLSAALQRTLTYFDPIAFDRAIHDEQWDQLELKQRMRHTTQTLHKFFPGDYRAALKILRQIIIELEQHSFEKTIFPDYVELYGLDDWDASLPALETFTQHMSAEFAVRPFILKDQDRMMAQMLVWSQHESEHVRRLASEGSRPRLPWAIALPALKADPTPILPILENLKTDESETVRRSVANNLNDIAKDNPQVVIDVVREWQSIETPEMRWLINHALRTLVKAGNPDALALLGYVPAEVKVENFTVTPANITMGETITFAFEVTSTAKVPQDLMIDYALHLVRAKGKQSVKIFKLSKQMLEPGETIELTKQHSFKPITTRRYYPGTHAIEIQINGIMFGKQKFELRES